MADLGFVAVLGGATGLGVAGLLVAIVGPNLPAPRWSASGSSGNSPLNTVMRKAVPALAVGGALGMLTGWPVLALLGAVGGVSIAKMFAGVRRRDTTWRIEAIAGWTELLRDTLIASAGLAQAIVASAEVAPLAIRTEVGRLADRIASGVSIVDALATFADDLADPSADLVVCALVLAAEARAQRLADLLSALAESIRDEVSMRLRIETGRASAQGSVRTIVIFSLGFAALMTVMARSYLGPFGSAAGQLVLMVVVGNYAAGIWLMARLVRDQSAARILATGGRR